VKQIPSLIKEIKVLGKEVGLAIKLTYAIAAVLPYLDQIDLLLVMTVNPGFGADRNSSASACPKSSRRRRGGMKSIMPIASVWMAASPTKPVPIVRVPAQDTFVAGTSLFGTRNLKSAVTPAASECEPSCPALDELEPHGVFTPFNFPRPKDIVLEADKFLNEHANVSRYRMQAGRRS